MSVGIINGNVSGMSVISFTYDPASVAANTTAEQTVTVPGLQTTDIVMVEKTVYNAGLSIGNARVSAADTLSIQFINNTASPIDAASQSFVLLVVRPSGGVYASSVLTS